MRIVLVRPRDPNNIGAAARAMANFGLTDLVLVAPYGPVWREAKSAVGAGAVLAAAREVATLEEAVGDRALVGATTAGTRRRLARVLDPAAFAMEARGLGDGAALVFGNEKSGLSTADLERCHAAVRVSTAVGQPSMNLGQAVAVCCYELTRGSVDAAPTARRTSERPATLAEIEDALAALVPRAPAASVETRRRAARDRLRALLLRARPSAPDVALLRGLVVKPASDND
jgi:tRNA/rRNA methyltransferase